MIGWLIDFRWRFLARRCGAAPPWSLADCGTCIRPRGHERWRSHDPEWHADGTGFIWDTERWRWMGPPVPMEGTGDLPS